MGGFQGDFASLAASELGAVAIRAAVERAGLKPDAVDQVIMGCVLPAGQGQAARAAGGAEGGPAAVGALHDGEQDVRLGDGGGDPRARHAGRGFARGDRRRRDGIDEQRALPAAEGARRLRGWAHEQVLDHMFLDGLEDAYDKGRLMGTFAEDCASKFAFTREEQDGFALESLKRAWPRTRTARFGWEIAPVDGRRPQGRASSSRRTSSRRRRCRTRSRR